MFQSAPPHWGRRGTRVPVEGGRVVSIRAPALGATGMLGTATTVIVVSIRAPALGATLANACFGDTNAVSIRAPALGATLGWTGNSRPSQVSIRAPALGATASIRYWHHWQMSFNPRPRTGGDPVYASLITAGCRFNPRPRTGGDIVRDGADERRAGFNPRPRTGGDRNSKPPLPVPAQFQSAPPHWGRPFLAIWSSSTHLFQSAPPHWGRPGRI